MRTFLAAGACAALAFLGMSVYLVLTNAAPSREVQPVEEVAVNTPPPGKRKREDAQSEPIRTALSPIPIPIPIDEPDAPPVPKPARQPFEPAPAAKPVEQPKPPAHAVADQLPPRSKRPRPPLPEDDDPPIPQPKRPRPPLPTQDTPAAPKRPRPPLPEDDDPPPTKPKAKPTPPDWSEDDSPAPKPKPAPRSKSPLNPPTLGSSANPTNPRPLNPRPPLVYSPTMYYTMTAGSSPSRIPAQVTIHNTPFGRMTLNTGLHAVNVERSVLARGTIASGVKRYTWEVRLDSGKVVVEFDGLRVRPR